MRTRLILGALLSCAACLGPPPPSSEGARERDPDAKPSGAAAAPLSNGGAGAAPKAAAPSCAPEDHPAGDTVFTLEFGGRTRETIVYQPALAAARSPAIVLVLHPLLLTHAAMKAIVKIERFADEGGFLAVFPNGVDHSWNAGECCGTAKDEKVDDVGFVRALVAEVARRWCADPTRVYAMGYSNGAFLSHRLACELDPPPRAIAPVSGTLGIPESSCRSAAPVPVFAVHGTDDRLVPFAGGPPDIPFGSHFGTFSSPAATDAFWSRRNGCPLQTSPGFVHGEVSCARHECAADVTLCTVSGGGHQWPGGPELPAMGHVTHDLDATEAAVTFFRQHGL